MAKNNEAEEREERNSGKKYVFNRLKQRLYNNNEFI